MLGHYHLDRLNGYSSNCADDGNGFDFRIPKQGKSHRMALRANWNREVDRAAVGRDWGSPAEPFERADNWTVFEGIRSYASTAQRPGFV